jgi:hypothetical protein
MKSRRLIVPQMNDDMLAHHRGNCRVHGSNLISQCLSWGHSPGSAETACPQMSACINTDRKFWALGFVAICQKPA